MKKTMATRIVVIIALVCMLVTGFAPMALAATPTPASVTAPALVQVSTASVCTSGSGSRTPGDSEALPVIRWADATSDMHSRLDGMFLADTAEKLQRHGMVSAGMSTGNFMWSLGTGLSAFAINFCVLDSMGGAADSVGATIGKAMLGSPLLAFIIIFAIVALLAQGRRRGQMPWKTIVAKGLLVGLFAAMVAGSMASTGGGKGGPNSPYNEDVTAAYKPGVMSPGWIVTMLNNTVASLASAPATALVLAEDDAALANKNDPLSCSNYVGSLKDGYQSFYGADADILSSGVPLIMSTLWEDTGLETWRIAQFGTADAKAMDGNAWCRLLEWNATSRTVASSEGLDKTNYTSTVRSTMYRHMDGNAFKINYDSEAFTPNDTVSKDRSIVAWSACKLKKNADPREESSWSVRSVFKNGDTENKIAPDDCKNWFNEPGVSLDAFDFPTDAGDVEERAENLDLREFILTLHGNDNSHGLTAVFAYNFSALAMLAVFGLISVAIIIAKLAMIIMIIAAFFMVIAAMMPNAGLGKLAGFIKMLLGIMVFIFGIQLLFAFISIITKMLQDLGEQFLGGPGSLVSTVWAGLSPLLAVMLLHMMFTKVLKVPSPFKISGGLAWGSAAGAAGGAAFAGVSSLLDRGPSRAGNRMKGAAKNAGARGLNTAMSAATGGRLGKGATAMRRGAAAPDAGKENGKRGALDGGKSAVASALGKSRRGAVGASGTAAASAAAGAAFGAAAGGLAGGAAVSGQAESGGTEPTEPTTAGAGKRSKSEKGAKVPQIDHTHLIDSNVANSQLGSGNMSAQERAAIRSAAKQEKIVSKDWEHDRRAEAGFAKPTGPVGKTLQPIRDSWSGARQQFREKPLRTTAKYAAGATLLTAAAPHIVAVPLIAGGAWAAKKGIGAAHRNTVGRRGLTDARVENYRHAMREAEHQRKNEAKQKEQAAAAARAAAGVGEKQQHQDDQVADKAKSGGNEQAPADSPSTGTKEQKIITPSVPERPVNPVQPQRPAPQQPTPQQEKPSNPVQPQQPAPQPQPQRPAPQREKTAVPMGQALSARRRAATTSRMEQSPEATAGGKLSTPASQRMSTTEFEKSPQGR